MTQSYREELDEAYLPSVPNRPTKLRTDVLGNMYSKQFSREIIADKV